MTTPFHKLTPKQAELLTLLMEECAEVIHIGCKIQRHGLDSAHPGAPDITNRTLLENEIGDVLAALDLVLQTGLLDLGRVCRARDVKLTRAPQFLHHLQDEH